MRIVKLKGGLGNQMFQYAFAKLIAKETGDVVKIDLSPYHELDNDIVRVPRIQKFNIKLPVATKSDISSLCKYDHSGNSQGIKYKIGILMETLLNENYYFEMSRESRSVDILKKASYFDGYWQSYHYVDVIIDELDEEFTPISDISTKSKSLLNKIESTNSVFVGIRRGDYLTVKPKHYGSLNETYYNDAMQYVKDRVSNAIFYIFSNDIYWVRDNMKFEQFNTVFITDTVDDFEDFILMTKCKHSIISNSTYYWWGARRHNNDDKVVVAPLNWFADNAPIDIVPENWIRL